MVVFIIVGISRDVMLRMQRFTFEEPRSREPPVQGWQELVIGVANGETPPSVVEELIANKG